MTSLFELRDDQYQRLVRGRAGNLADAYGLQVVMWMLAGMCITICLLCMGLRETAPRVLARRAGAA